MPSICRRSPQWRWFAYSMLCVLLTAWMGPSSAYVMNLNMHSGSSSSSSSSSHHSRSRTPSPIYYQPPVKSSVMSQLHHRRDGRSRSKDPRTAQSSYSASLSVAEGPAAPSSFERRMREMVLARPMSPVSSSRRRNNNKSKDDASGGSRRSSPSTSVLPPNVHAVETLLDYKRLVGDERERVVAVRFYASYCKACKAVAPHFYRLAADYPNVVFVDVPVTQYNAALHQGLGVPTLPYSHIYQPSAGLVEEQRLTRKDVAAFQEKLESYVCRSCPIVVPEDGGGAL